MPIEIEPCEGLKPSQGFLFPGEQVLLKRQEKNLDLTEFETKALSHTLDGDHPVLSELRRQLDASILLKKCYTGVGFYFDFLIPKEIKPINAVLDVPANFVITDAHAHIGPDKDWLGFLLFVRDGRLVMFEGTVLDDYPDIVEQYYFYYSWDGDRQIDKMIFRHHNR